MDEESTLWIQKFREAFLKILITTFFYSNLLLLLSFVFVLQKELKPNTWIDVLVLADIGIFFSSSCVLALGEWIAPIYRLPNLLGFLQHQSELKIKPAPSRHGARPRDYLEKVRSVNTVVSILILIVTVLMVLNHAMKQAEKEKCSSARTEDRAWATGITVDSDHPLSNEPAPKPREGHPVLIMSSTDTKLSPCFREFMFDMNYFLGLLSFLFGLWTAEILDTAANPFVNRPGISGILKQRFFYHEAMAFGGSGHYYVTVGFFSLLMLSIFSLLLNPLIITLFFVCVIVFASRYFYGYYEERCYRMVDLHSDTRWRFRWYEPTTLGVFLGTLLAGIGMGLLMYSWFVRCRSCDNFLWWAWIASCSLLGYLVNHVIRKKRGDCHDETVQSGS